MKGIFVNRYIKELDGLRGFAILAVVLVHLFPNLLPGGFLGVDIFFVLSGFLITSLLLKEYNQNQRIDLRGFYIRRVRRLLPALVAFLVIFGVYAKFQYSAEEFTKYSIGAFSSLAYVHNWIVGYTSYSSASINHFWSLSVEEQFYLFWPLIVLFGLRKRHCGSSLIRIFLATLLFVVCLRVAFIEFGVHPLTIYCSTFSRMDGMIIGALLAYLLASAEKNCFLMSELSRYSRYLSLFALAPIFLSMITLSTSALSTYTWGISLTCLCTCVVILDVFTNENGLVRAALGWKPLVQLGKISYGVYIWHYPINCELARLGVTSFWRACACILLTLVVSVVSYHFFEIPLINWLRARKGAPFSLSPVFGKVLVQVTSRRVRSNTLYLPGNSNTINGEGTPEASS